MVSQVYPTLITERLKLRPLQLKDAATMQQTLKDRDVWRYFPLSEIPSLKKTQTYIEGQLEHWAAHGFGHWALENGSHDLLGWCGLQFLPETNETEVAYCLGKPFWGKGYATEAARASLSIWRDFSSFLFLMLRYKAPALFSWLLFPRLKQLHSPAVTSAWQDLRAYP
jgi:ribosomal-protein-alanine N-acetyltransferase